MLMLDKQNPIVATRHFQPPEISDPVRTLLVYTIKHAFESLKGSSAEDAELAFNWIESRLSGAVNDYETICEWLEVNPEMGRKFARKVYLLGKRARGGNRAAIAGIRRITKLARMYVESRMD